MSSTRDAIIQFFRAKGVPDNVIYGILGNLQVESSLNPGAYNANEGAIGLAQWEGGRRTALQSWARAHGGSERDLDMQLGYLWHELQTSESAAWQQVLHSGGSAGAAAAAWDQYYERSTGAARQQRISYAEQFAGGYGPSGESHTLLTGGAPMAAQDQVTKAELYSVDSLGKLLDSVPELSHLVDQAVSGNWTLEKFQNQVENSKWYKTHSSTARGILVQQANDPSSYRQQLSAAENAVHALANQLGFALNPTQIAAIAGNALLTGNDSNQQWLAQQIGRREDYSKLTSTKGLGGGMAQTVSQLQQMAGDYGYTWTPAQLAGQAQQVLMGNTTIDTYQNRLKAWAKSAFPGLSKQIDEGQTLKQLADPYVQSMSRLLEIDPNTLDVYNPTIRKALQGSVDPQTKTLAPTTLYNFEKQVRTDPRWQYTNNAKDTMSSALVQMGQTFGFAV